MNRRNFAFSWGRKIFFGISWPLSIVLSLLYLKSFILPTSVLDVVYYVTTLIGHTGLLTAIFYFLLFAPVIYLFPSYYISRFWAIILIAVLNILIVTDALSFSNYHLHIYSYLYKLYLEEGLQHLFGITKGPIILGAVTLVMAILIWIRGEIIWRYMQTRFSNPVKNWYLVVIILLVVISRVLFHTTNVHPSLSENFFLNLYVTKPLQVFPENKNFIYPYGDLKCEGKNNPNIVLIILNQWNTNEFNEELMPETTHISQHAKRYLGHRNISSNSDTGLFTLMYSLPSHYFNAVRGTKPPIITELTKRKYELVNFLVDPKITDPTEKDKITMEQFRDWMSKRTGEEINSHFIMMTLDQDASASDANILAVINELQKEALLENSYVIITGKYSGSDAGTIPLLWISPERKVSEVSHLTTHYDLLPTLMTKAWDCKNAFAATGYGVSLDKKDREWFLVTHPTGFKIVDLKGKGELLVENNSVTGNGRKELVFEALKLLTKFNRP